MLEFIVIVISLTLAYQLIGAAIAIGIANYRCEKSPSLPELVIWVWAWPAALVFHGIRAIIANFPD